MSEDRKLRGKLAVSQCFQMADVCYRTIIYCSIALPMDWGKLVSMLYLYQEDFQKLRQQDHP